MMEASAREHSEIRDPKSAFELTVIGVGNWLMGDDGAAVRLIERLAGDPAASADGRIEYLDGGVGGLRLINWIEQARRLLLIDAARFGGRPGQCRLFRLDDLLAKPRTEGSGLAPSDSGASRNAGTVAAAPFSLHQTDLVTVLELARRFYRVPPTWLLAVQIESVEQRERLSDPLAARLDRLVEIVRRLAPRLARTAL